MFDFFEEMIGRIGIKLVGDFTEKLCDFIRNIKENDEDCSSGNFARIGSSGNSAQIGISGGSAKIGSSGNSARIGSSGDSAKIGSSGNSAQIGSSGDFAKIGSSGNSARIGSSGDFARIGSSGNYAKIGSSGNSARIGSSGDSAKIGSSGNSAQIGISGNSAKIGSSGNYAQIGSSGDFARIGSSGNYARIGSPGNSAQIGSSGNSAKIGSSGNSAKIGISGDFAKIGSSGNYAQIGSSGDFAKIDILGKYGVGFACGYKSIIKAKKGTWISLCEYEKQNGAIVPVYALSAQIGNKEYKDFRGRILKETEYYCLYNKNFYPVDISDEITILKLSEKKRNGIIIIKGQTFDGDECYLVKENEITSHGETLRSALEDLRYKKIKSNEIEQIVNEIKETKKVNRSQYRALTGACQFGTEQFCKQHNIQELEEIELDKLRKILINDYGAEQFWKLIDEK